MFNQNKPIPLPPQLNWKYAYEPQLLGWTIEARDYSTFIANIGMLLISLIGIGAAVFMYSAFGTTGQPWRTIWSALLFALPCLLTWKCGFGQRINIAYRFSKSGWEYCEWKDTPKWHLTMVKWATAVILVMFLALAALDPIFMLGALIGPAGMTLTYLSMANSETYQQLDTRYHHSAYEWSGVKQLAIVKNREAVNLKNKSWDNNIFCKRGQKEAVAQLIRPHLPAGVPFVRAKINTVMRIQEGEPI